MTVIASGGVLFALVRPLEEGGTTEQPTSGNFRGHVMEKPWNKAKRRLAAFRASFGHCALVPVQGVCRGWCLCSVSCVVVSGAVGAGVLGGGGRSVESAALGVQVAQGRL